MLPGEVLEMYVRSSIGINKDLILKNVVGIIDQDYYENVKNDGNIGICLINIGQEIREIKIEERIAQGIFKNFLPADNIICEEIRGGGIGSTDKK
jgi:dUTP pyrophosphatase